MSEERAGIATEHRPTDVEEVAANLAAVRIFAIYAAASACLALAERNAIAGERTLSFHRTWKQVFEEMAAEPRGAVQDRANRLVVQMFAELDATIRHFATPLTPSGDP